MNLKQIEQHHPDLIMIMEACFAAFGVSPAESNSRRRHCVQARHAFLLLVWDNYYFRFGVVAMGEILAALTGKEIPYNHSTIIYTLNNARAILLLRDDVSIRFRDNYLRLKKEIFPYNQVIYKQILKPLTTPV